MRDVQIVSRQVSTVEGVLAGLNSRQLNQDNNIQIAYVVGPQEIVLRLEMLTGVTVMGQAKKCREFEDRLRNLGIRDRFRASGGGTQGSSAPNIPEQIAKLAALRDQGAITDEEFEAKKHGLLARM